MTTTTQVRERPILFSDEMVRAILDGRKTQTRRVVKGLAEEPEYMRYTFHETVDGEWEVGWEDVRGGHGFALHYLRCPYGQPGDRLWVREAWARMSPDRTKVCDAPPGYDAPGYEIVYRADYPSDQPVPPWRPSIHMPRWASRITLEITDVRVERVQEIGEEDAIAEGVTHAGVWWEVAVPGHRYRSHDPVRAFAYAWDRLNAKRGYGWDRNQFVWAITFRRVED